MMANCEQIACHMHGCCIMQKSIDMADPTQKQALVVTIAKHTRAFV